MSFFYIDSRQHTDNQSIILHGRKIDDKKRYFFFVNDFFPYIGVENNEENLKKVLELEKRKLVLEKEFFYRGNIDEPYYDQFDRYVIKLYLPSTRTVKRVRTSFKVTHQDDVPYTRVFKVDKNIHSGFHIIDFDEIMKRKPKDIHKWNTKFEDLYAKYLVVSHHSIVGF